MDHSVRTDRKFQAVFYGAILVALSGSALLLTDAWTVLRFMFGVTAFALLFKRPELALAIQLNGVLLYLYSIYKLGFETSTLMTGSFYGIVAAAYLGGGLFLAAKQRNWFRLSVIDLLFGVLFSLFFISYFLHSTDNEFALQKVNYAPLLVVAPYIGVQFLLTSGRLWRFLEYRALVSALLILPAFYELFSNPLFEEYGRFSIYVFSGRSDNPILFSITFAILLIILFFKMAERKKIEAKYLWLMLPAALLMLRSGARGPLVSFLCTMAFFLFNVGALKTKTKVTAAALLLVLAVLAYNFIPDRTVSFYQTLLGNTVTTQDEADRSIQERIVLMSLAIEEFKSNPIFGVGTGNSSGGVGFPHNALIEVAAEFGLFGLVLFLLLCGAAVRKSVLVIRAEPPGQPDYLMRLALSLFIFAFVESMFSSYMGGDTLFYNSLGLISAVAKMRESELSKSRVEQKWDGRELSIQGNLAGA